MEGNIVSEVSQGRETFLKIQRNIQHAVNETIPVVSASIENAGRSLASASKNITSLIDKINKEITKVYIPHLKIAQDNIEEYSIYRLLYSLCEP